MTLVQFIVNFLRPYADMPEFTICVLKAMGELGCIVDEEDCQYTHGSTKNCHIAGKECDE